MRVGAAGSDKHVARLVQLGLAHLGHQEAADRLSLVRARA